MYPSKLCPCLAGVTLIDDPCRGMRAEIARSRGASTPLKIAAEGRAPMRPVHTGIRAPGLSRSAAILPHTTELLCTHRHPSPRSVSGLPQVCTHTGIRLPGLPRSASGLPHTTGQQAFTAQGRSWHSSPSNGECGRTIPPMNTKPSAANATLRCSQKSAASPIPDRQSVRPGGRSPPRPASWESSVLAAWRSRAHRARPRGTSSPSVTSEGG